MCAYRPHGHDLPVESIVALLGFNLLVVNLLNLCGRRTHLEMLEEFVDCTGITLCLTSYGSVVHVLRMTSNVEAVGLLDGEGATNCVSDGTESAS